MTQQERIDKINTYNKKIAQEKERHSKALKEIREEFAGIYSGCTHEYSDGSSAWYSDYYSKGCRICDF